MTQLNKFLAEHSGYKHEEFTKAIRCMVEIKTPFDAGIVEIAQIATCVLTGICMDDRVTTSARHRHVAYNHVVIEISRQVFGIDGKWVSVADIITRKDDDECKLFWC